ncbi:MAG: ComEC/Rec2 family competence protein [Bacteroidota bacterium]
MKFINLTMVRLAGSLTAGIIVAYFSPEIWKTIPTAPLFFFIIAAIILALFFTWFWQRNKLQPGIFFGSAVYFCFFVIGFSNYQLSRPEYQKQHYVHINSMVGPQLIQLKITEILSENHFNHRYEAQLLQLDSTLAKGKVLFSVEKDSAISKYTKDTKLLVYGTLSEISAPLNPHQFNYKKYLKNKGIYRQLKTSRAYVVKTSKGRSTLKGRSDEIRNNIIEKLNKTSIQPKQRALLQALVLGYKKDIDEEQYQAFAAAGALHILAVSGLHVGILFLVFSKLLSPLRGIKFGRQIQSMLVVFLLWSFAILAGLSPSVVRAVTMFSFFALAGMLKRPTNGFNTLFLSYFVLLLYEPNWLFHLGFQLSYLAVFHILWIQPALFKLYIPKYYLDRLFWGIATVTIAAQLGVAPLSLYYFHQFPGLFFITNLVILPFLSVILICGLIVVLLAIVGLLPQTFASAYNWVLAQLNDFINWVARKEMFLFDEVPFSFFAMIACYFFLITLVIWLKNKSSKRLVYVGVSCLFWLGIVVSENKKVEQEQLVVFHSFGKTYFGYQKDRDFILYHSDTRAPFTEYPVKSYLIERRVSTYTSAKIPKIFRYKYRWVVRLDSVGVYPVVERPIILLTHNSKIHLNRLIDSLHPTQIIADGSNYPSVVSFWKSTCLKRKIPFHYTGEKGAFVF